MAALSNEARSGNTETAAQPSAGGGISFHRWVGPRGRFPGVVFVLIGLAGIGNLGAVSASAQGPGEYQVKAAFLYNFTKFIEWPAGISRGNGDSLMVCVMGEDPFDHALEEVVKGKNLNARRLRFGTFRTFKRQGVARSFLLVRRNGGRYVLSWRV